MPDKIYVITMIHVSEQVLENKEEYDWSNSSERSPGFFFDFENAEKAVLDNSMDIYECEYNLAVIEEVLEGLYNYTFKEFWYLYNKDNNKYTKIDKPKFLENTIGFGLG